MEMILLSLLLVTGSSASESELKSSGIRIQAAAKARIVSGEVVRLGGRNSVALSKSRRIDAQSFLLPVAHSKGASEEFPQSTLVEFH